MRYEVEILKCQRRVMERRLDGITERTQALGGPVAPDEIAMRWQLAHKRLKRIPFTPEEEAWWKGAGQTGGGQIPHDLAKTAKQVLFSKQGAFPIGGLKGGAFSLDGLADKATSLAGSDKVQGLMDKAKSFGDSDKAKDLLGKAQGLVDGKPSDLLGAVAPGAGALMGQASGIASALSKGDLGALPKAKGPSLESFLESQGVPVIPIKPKKTPGDFLGNGARWWVKAAASPYLGTLVKLTFMFMFFTSFLEATPLVGSVLSVALDATLAGGRILVKILQKGIPVMFGLIPLPGAQLFGMVLVSVVGMFVWTIFAVISFSRQDFTSAIDSMLRIIPMPIGDALADGFLDINRTVDQMNDKRIKLTEDVWNGLLLVQDFGTQIAEYFQTKGSEAYKRVKSGSDTLLDAVRGIRGATPAVPTATPVTEPVAEPVPTATPVTPETPAPEAPPAPTAPVPEPAAPVTPEAPAPDAPPAPAPAPAPAPVPEPAAPAPAPAPAPVPAPAPAPAPAPELKTPETPVSALERLRGQKTNIDVGKGFRGGKTLSTKRREARKWTIRQLSARFSGAGLR
jgi:hypothetical protein